MPHLLAPFCPPEEFRRLCAIRGIRTADLRRATGLAPGTIARVNAGKVVDAITRERLVTFFRSTPVDPSLVYTEDASDGQA